MIATDKANELRNELEEVRGAWADWVDRWTQYQQTLRHAGYNTFRLDAYQVGVGSDEGGGQSMVGWLDEIEADLMGEAE
jgi:hypothetical protein